ncbi:MAG: hypothetical protein ACTHMP_03920 [Thermomicrobiales bacterium]|jgi:hypothetical protein
MDPVALQLAKDSGRASAMYAGGFAVIYFVLSLLSKIPIVGLLFFCLNGLLCLAVYFGIAYFITPKLRNFPAGQSPAMVALYIGVGVAVVVTAAVLVAILILGIIGVIVGAGLGGSSNAFGSTLSGFLGLIIQLIGYTIYGLIIGTLLAFLGSFVILNRNKNVQPAAPTTSGPF